MAAPLARLLANLIVMSGSVLFKAFQQAYAQALQNAPAAARQLKMTPDEAKKILNLSKQHDMKEVAEAYERLFHMNDPKKGGSFYLQSKVFRAKEALEKEFGPPDPKKPGEQGAGDAGASTSGASSSGSARKPGEQ